MFHPVGLLDGDSLLPHVDWVMADFFIEYVSCKSFVELLGGMPPNTCLV